MNNRQVTVFGANGRIGRLVVAALQAKGINTVAAVHANHSFTESDSLRVVNVDIYDNDSVARAIEGSTVIISALGSWGTKRKDVVAVGVASIIGAMQEQSIRRVISLTGADSRAAGDTLGLIHSMTHFILSIMAGKILRDGELHIMLLEKSGLDWTVIRSPVMKDGKHFGHGELTLRRPYPWQIISRNAVASAIVSCAVEDTWVEKAPFIV